MLNATPNLKKVLRKIKTLPTAVKAAILAGCKNQEAYIQVCADCATYNLWECLLYVNCYAESDGYFAPGTAQAALNAAAATKTIAKKVAAAAKVD